MERTKKGLCLAKLESAYAVEATPTAGLDILPVVNSQWQWGPEYDAIQRMILDGGLRTVAGDNALPRVSFSFQMELRGNRTNGSSPDISAGSSTYALEMDDLLQACDMNPTYVAESTGGARDGYVVYKPAAPVDEGKGCTFFLYTEKKLHKVVGAKGSLKLTLEAGKYCYLHFEFKGLYNTVPTDSSIPSPTFLDTRPPLWVNGGTTYDAWSGGVVSKIDLDLGNTVNRRDDGNSIKGVKGFAIYERASKLSFNPESVSEATHPVFSDLDTAKTKTLITNLGSQSGNRFNFTMAGQQRKVSYGDQNGNRITQIEMELNAAAMSSALGNEFQMKCY